MAIAVTVTVFVFVSSAVALKARTPTVYVVPSVKPVMLVTNEFAIPVPQATVAVGVAYESDSDAGVNVEAGRCLRAVRWRIDPLDADRPSRERERPEYHRWRRPVGDVVPVRVENDRDATVEILLFESADDIESPHAE